ncbi:uncharacterized protein LOC107003196 isoform X2 [Solanum pennellii]|uniref:Uncharacterized protein LOC107003196 isoform X2 n=1 Tax=Solanum pennellii TaxID=28526 RepID=A0ABM1UYA6_SOLPN|nr:uncharacterized protein LOC107003196 isoform X2 [Solanum pennellii]
MDQLKFQIDEILNKLKERSTGQSDLFEMISKLEQAKSCLLVEAMVAGKVALQVAGGVADDQQVAGGVALQVAGGMADVLQMAGGMADVLQVAGGMADDQQMAGGMADVLQVAGGMADDQQMAGGMADVLQVAGGMADDQQMAGGMADVLQVAGGMADVLQVAGGMADVLQVAGGMADDQQVAGGMADDQQVAGGMADVLQVAGWVDNDLRWMYSWDLCDDETFVWMSPAPIPWFTKDLVKDIERDSLDINLTLGTILLNASPPTCFLKSPKFSSVGMPVTLTSSKLTDIVTCPAVLMIAGEGTRYSIHWPVLGHKFVRHSTIRLWYQWKSFPFGWKHKLFITIESESAEAGPSNQTTGRKRSNMQ